MKNDHISFKKGNHAQVILCEHLVPVVDLKTIDYSRLWNSCLTKKDRYDGVIIVPCTQDGCHRKEHSFG